MRLYTPVQAEDTEHARFDALHVRLTAEPVDPRLYVLALGHYVLGSVGGLVDLRFLEHPFRIIGGIVWDQGLRV